MSRLPPNRVVDPGVFGRVGLAVGGDSAEREVSLDGGQAVGAALERLGITNQVFDGPAALFETIQKGQIDRVFNLIHGPGGEDGSLQGALQLMKIPVTGAGLAASALTMDKVRSKWVWERNGIATPAFEYFGPEDHGYDRALDKFGLPVFVKPTGLGSSIGISRVSDESALPEAIELARRYGDTVIIEAEIAGEEFFAGVVGGIMLPLIRVETPNEFYDYQAKYESDETRYFCPCGLEAGREASLLKASRNAFDVLGTSGWGRVDFLMDATGKAWFLEVNTTPGMTSHSLVPQAAAELGIGFDELVWRILETSL
jgi:D-alanine-D-alanine ligase